MGPAELEVQRYNTAAFIDADPVYLTLVRRLRVRTDAGGWAEAEVSLAPQKFRLIPLSDRTPQAETADGERTLPAFTLLGSHDADLAPGDTFELQGGDFRLEGLPRPLHSLSVYERKMDVVRRG